MRTTTDPAGRRAIPKALRDEIGLVPGEVDVSVDGAAVRVEPVTSNDLVEEDGFLVLPASGVEVDDELVGMLRFADQR